MIHLSETFFVFYTLVLFVGTFILGYTSNTKLFKGDK